VGSVSLTKEFDMNYADQGFMEALDEIKMRMIKDGGNAIVPGIIEKILEVEDYPRGEESGYYIQEEMLEKLIWTTHAVTCNKIFDTFISMVKDGAINVNERQVTKLAGDKCKDMISELKEHLKNNRDVDKDVIRAFRNAVKTMEVSPENQEVLEQLKKILREADE
jgi:hypothetical protein